MVFGGFGTNLFAIHGKKMNTFKQPFHSAIFTLSSHHPYKIPEKYKGKFPKGDLENSESIAYADYALRQFLQQLKKRVGTTIPFCFNRRPWQSL